VSSSSSSRLRLAVSPRSVGSVAVALSSARPARGYPRDQTSTTAESPRVERADRARGCRDPCFSGDPETDSLGARAREFSAIRWPVSRGWTSGRHLAARKPRQGSRAARTRRSARARPRARLVRLSLRGWPWSGGDRGRVARDDFIGAWRILMASDPFAFAEHRRYFVAERRGQDRGVSGRFTDSLSKTGFSRS